MSSHYNHHRVSMSSAGFSYVEILLSIVLVGVLLVPALDALRTAITGTSAMAAGASGSELQSKMEEVVAAPFSKLYAETYVSGGNTTTSVSAFSDPSGAARRRLVVIYRYDALLRALASTDTGLVLVSVYYETEGPDGALNTLVGRWW